MRANRLLLFLLFSPCETMPKARTLKIVYRLNQKSYADIFKYKNPIRSYFYENLFHFCKHPEHKKHDYGPRFLIGKIHCPHFFDRRVFCVRGFYVI